MPRIKVRASMKSNASIFSDRGDPWVSEKEGREYPEKRGFTGNPELDQFHCQKAQKRLVMKSEHRSAPVNDKEKRVAGIMNRMHMAIAKVERETASRLAMELQRRLIEREASDQDIATATAPAA
jgi:hypothetical protein